MNMCCNRWSWLFAVVAICGGVALSMSAAEGRKADDAAAQCVKLAREVYAEMVERAGSIDGYDIEDLELWSRNLLAAELEAAGNPDERTAAHAAHVKRTKELEELVRSFVRGGQAKKSDELAAEFYRLQAERGHDGVRQ
jgi:hypothetical protein